MRNFTDEEKARIIIALESAQIDEHLTPARIDVQLKRESDKSEVPALEGTLSLSLQ